MIVLGIETSCDETSVAIVENGKNVILNAIASSLKLHKRYGGIVPEIATRHHVEVILPLFAEVLKKSKLAINDIDLISVTQGPGLIGSLMVGITFAKSLAYAIKIPILGVDHLLSHLYAVYLNGKEPQFPYLGLVVSGGHTSLFLVKDFLEFEIIGKTRDDALGEAFDKVAKILNLGFPGGPIIEKKSKEAKKKDFSFPKTIIKNSFDFSYSGLKTAVMYYIRRQRSLNSQSINEICYAFQETAINTLLEQVKRAITKFRIKRLITGGGVIANERIRESLQDLAIELYLPQIKYCTDNAAMVAGLGYQLYNKGVHREINFEPYSTFEEKWT